MKVLQINAVYRASSTGRNLYELHTVMQSKGIDSYIAATHMDTLEKNCYQIGSPMDWKIHGLLSRLLGMQGYFSYKATKNLLRHMDQINPDVVHLNNCHANYLNLDMLFNYLAEKDIATVITLHDCWFYTGKCTHYTTEKCYKWKTGCGNCSKLKTDNKSWFFDRTSKMWADKKRWFEAIPRLGVVGVSDWITSEAEQSIMNSAKIIRRIYNWIDLDVFKERNSNLRSRLNLENKYIILGVAGSWGESKGLLHFIELAKLLRDDEVIVLVGNMPEQSLPKNIMHINATNNVQELVEYYSMADVFMQLSLQESFGKVVAEALSCGTPVITVASTANAELVADGCGAVHSELIIENMLESVQIIKEKGKEHYKAACRLFAEQNFDMCLCAESYINLYKELSEHEE